jgi:DNA-binding NarL/FixJ family response regulator
VVDRSPLYMLGITTALRQSAALPIGPIRDVCEVASCGIDEIPDVIMLGWPRDGQTTSGALAELRRRPRLRNARIMVLLFHARHDQILEVLRLGADALVTRTASAEQMVAAVQAVIRGERWIDPVFVAALGKSASVRTRRPESLLLTRREQEVLEELAAGRSTREIADRLIVSIPTVKSHQSSIYRKLGVGNRSEAVARALSLRILL